MRKLFSEIKYPSKWHHRSMCKPNTHNVLTSPHHFFTVFCNDSSLNAIKCKALEKDLPAWAVATWMRLPHITCICIIVYASASSMRDNSYMWHNVFVMTANNREEKATMETTQKNTLKRLYQQNQKRFWYEIHGKRQSVVRENSIHKIKWIL